MYETMNVNADEGDKIIFSYPENGYEYDQEKAQKHLEVGQEYTVSYTEVSGYSTAVHLKEVPDISFNSVMFSDVINRKDKILHLISMKSDIESAYYGGYRVSALLEDVETLAWAIKELEKR